VLNSLEGFFYELFCFRCSLLFRREPIQGAFAEGITMRKIICILAACALAVTLTNCAPAASSVVDKGIKYAKLLANNNEAVIKKIEDFLDANKKAEFEKELETACKDKDDFKNVEAVLDCLINNKELLNKAEKAGDEEAKKAITKARQKCEELAKKISEDCDKAYEAINNAVKGAATK